MLSINSQRKIYDNYKNGTTTKIGRNEYFIQYNPVAYTHTWVVLKRNKVWNFLQPLNEEVR